MVVEFLIVLVHQHRRAGGGFELRGAADVIDMGVGDDDRLHAQRMLLQNRENVVDVVAGVDHQRFARLLVAEDRAIALQHANGQDFVDHMWIKWDRRCGLIIQ